MIIEYEVSLAELTMVQDLRSLNGGQLPEGGREAWLKAYGDVVGPLNAKGWLVQIDGQDLILTFRTFSLIQDAHPRFRFQFDAPLPPTDHGSLKIRDINYLSSEGVSRLALRPELGVTVSGDDRPANVQDIPEIPKVLLSDDDERRSREMTVAYQINQEKISAQENSSKESNPEPAPPLISTYSPAGLVKLLDESQTNAFWLWLIAAFLGAAHAIQPGHGKTLAALASLEGRGAGVAMAIVATITHWITIVIAAVGLWVTRTTQFEAWNTAIVQTAGTLLAFAGCWRLGRIFGGFDQHNHHGHDSFSSPNSPRGWKRILIAGISGGMIPCWDAILLIFLAYALNQFTWGLFLLTGFCLGMGLVLITIGWTAGKLLQRIPSTQNQTQKIAALFWILFGGWLAFFS